ncbi:MAG: hypothetical protein AAF557_22755 [Pseudomonadota bacterium]
MQIAHGVSPEVSFFVTCAAYIAAQHAQQYYPMSQGKPSIIILEIWAFSAMTDWKEPGSGNAKGQPQWLTLS